MRALTLLLTLCIVTIPACTRSDDVASLVDAAEGATSLKVRQDACTKLADIPEDSAVEALVGFLDDESLWYCAAHGLGIRKASLAVGPLHARLDPASPRTQKFVWALGEIGDPIVAADLEVLRGAIDATTEDGKRTIAEIDEAISKLRGPM